jgi:hypothetical protein
MKITIIASTILLFVTLFASNAFAQGCGTGLPACAAGEACIGGSCITNPISTGTVTPPATGATAFWVSRFFTFTLPMVGILGFLFFLWTGFQFLMSRGDPKGLAAAKARLTYTIAGLTIVFLAYTLTLFFTNLFGLVAP